MYNFSPVTKEKIMIDQIVVVYCFCDEITKAVNFKDNPQCQMSSAEVMTFAVISAMHFGGDYRKTRLFAKHHNYFSKVLSLSQLVRRIHQIPETVLYCVFHSTAYLIQYLTRINSTHRSLNTQCSLGLYCDR